MELALRDKKIFQMNAELENRKKLLCLKRRQLMHNKRENNLLQGVLDDYEKYNKHIISNKERQIVFFQQLHSYIENITKDLQLTDHKLLESRNEQREITKEISFLKDELDNLVDNNDEYINSNSNIDE
jgi:septal ring factor EnvC (AmiA/AmiB activator)